MLIKCERWAGGGSIRCSTANGMNFQARVVYRDMFKSRRNNRDWCHLVIE
jgi:hypothetical protein